MRLIIMVLAIFILPWNVYGLSMFIGLYPAIKEQIEHRNILWSLWCWYCYTMMVLAILIVSFVLFGGVALC